MKEFILQFLKAQIGLRPFHLLRDESLVGIRQFRCSFFHTSFKTFIQLTQRRFGSFLLTEIAADRRDIHRFSGARIVDPEAV